MSNCRDDVSLLDTSVTTLAIPVESTLSIKDTVAVDSDSRATHGYERSFPSLEAKRDLASKGHSGASFEILESECLSARDLETTDEDG